MRHLHEADFVNAGCGSLWKGLMPRILATLFPQPSFTTSWVITIQTDGTQVLLKLKTLTIFQRYVQTWISFAKFVCIISPTPCFKNSKYLALYNYFPPGNKVSWCIFFVNCFPGFPSMGVMWQRLENPALRTFLQMQPDQKVNIRTLSDFRTCSRSIPERYFGCVRISYGWACLI